MRKTGKDSKWSGHNILVSGSGQTWLAMIGLGIEPMGEMQNKNQIYQEQIAATIAGFAAVKFMPEHPVAGAINIASKAD